MRTLTRLLTTTGMAAALVGAALAPGAAAGSPAPDPGAVGVSAGSGSLLVAGTSTPFVPRGFNTVGILYPEEYASTLCAGVGMGANTMSQLAVARDALQHHPDRELLAMASHWRANAVRLQVSQGALALEHASRGRHPYTDAVLSVVRQARAMGLVTIVSVQTQFYGCTPLGPDGKLVKLPNADTIDAWRQLAPALGHDAGVVLELFNEPQTRTACSTGVEWSWPQWAYGCDADPAGDEGMVPLGRAVRAMAPDNALLFDGDNNAGKLNDFVPPAGIPDNSAYAVHPYYYADGPASWDSRFGDLQASGHTLVATEWNESGTCQAPELGDRLVRGYLPDHDIGLFVHSWDAPGAYLVSPVRDPVDSIPTCKDFTGASLAYDEFWAQAGGGDPDPLIRVASVRAAHGVVDGVTVALADDGGRDPSTGPLVARAVQLSVRTRGHQVPLANLRLSTGTPWTNGSFTLATATALSSRPITARSGDTLIVRAVYQNGQQRTISYPIR